MRGYLPPPPEALSLTCLPPYKKKMTKISHFRQILEFLPPQKRILPPQKFLVLPLVFNRLDRLIFSECGLIVGICCPNPGPNRIKNNHSVICWALTSTYLFNFIISNSHTESQAPRERLLFCCIGLLSTEFLSITQNTDRICGLLRLVLPVGQPNNSILTWIWLVQLCGRMRMALENTIWTKLLKMAVSWSVLATKTCKGKTKDTG